MIQDLIEIVIAYFQYLSLAVNVAESAADESSTWATIKSAINLSLFDEQFFSHFFSFLPSTVDARHYFLVIGVLLPLSIVTFGLFALLPARVVAWYVVMLCGLGLTIVGGVVAMSPRDSVAAAATGQADDGLVLVITGVVFIVFGLFAALLYRTALASNSKRNALAVPSGLYGDEEEEEDELEAEMGSPACPDESFQSPASGGGGAAASSSTPPPFSSTLHADEDGLRALFSRRQVVSVLRIVELAGSTVIFLCAGLYLLGALPFLPERVHGVLGQSAVPLAVILFLAAAVTLTWLLLGMSKRGSELLRRVGGLLTKRVMKAVLLAMSMLYMPIAKSTIVLFNCSTFTCPAGSRMYDQGSLALPADLQHSLDICLPCTVAGNQTGVAPTRVLQTMCAGSQQQRLEFSKGVACSAVQTFFLPAAALVILGFIIVVPVLFFVLIRQTSALMQLHVPINAHELEAFHRQRAMQLGGVEGEDGGTFSNSLRTGPTDIDDWRWSVQVSKTSHVVRALYKPSRSRYRYWKLVETVRRFIVVFVSSYVIRASVPNARIALSVTLCCHTVAGVLTAALKPFIELIEDLVGAILAVMLAAVAAILLSSSFSARDAKVFSVLGVVNVTLPLLVATCAIAFALYKIYLVHSAETVAMKQRAKDLDAIVRAERRKLAQEKREQDLQQQQNDRLFQAMVLRRGSDTTGSGVLKSIVARRQSTMFKIDDDDDVEKKNINSDHPEEYSHADVSGAFFESSIDVQRRMTPNPPSAFRFGTTDDHPPPLPSWNHPAEQSQRRSQSDAAATSVEPSSIAALAPPTPSGRKPLTPSGLVISSASPTSLPQTAVKDAPVSGGGFRLSQQQPQPQPQPPARRRILSLKDIPVAASRRTSSEPPPAGAAPARVSVSMAAEGGGGAGEHQRQGLPRLSVSLADEAAGGSNPLQGTGRRSTGGGGVITAAMNAMAASARRNTGNDGGPAGGAKPAPLIKPTHRRTVSVTTADLEGLETTNLTGDAEDEIHRRHQQAKDAAAKPKESVEIVIRRRVEEELRKATTNATARAVQGELTASEAAVFSHETEKVLEKLLVGEIDTRINRVAHVTLTRFLLYMGLLLFVAFGCSFFGVLSMTRDRGEELFIAGLGALDASSAPVNSGGEAPVELSFAGYLTFSNFTRNCACAPLVFSLVTGRAGSPDEAAFSSRTFVFDSGGGNRTRVNAIWKLERWLCSNARMVERIRAVRISTTNLTSGGQSVAELDATGTVRGLCERQFRDPACAATIVGSGNAATVRLNLSCTLPLTTREAVMW